MHDMIYTLAEAFHAQHKQLYIVGGTVRDVLLHREESNDEDLATDATPDEIKRPGLQGTGPADDMMDGWID